MSFSIESLTELAQLESAINRGTRVVSISGLTSVSSKAFILAQLQNRTKKTLCVVAETNKELETWECDLNFWRDADRSIKEKTKNKNSVLLTFPTFETDVYSGISPHAETQEERALTLWKLTNEKPNFVVASAKALLMRVASPAEMKNLGANLKRDADFPPEELIEKLAACGYVREEPLKNVGEFSVRGGILDVWSPTMDNPVRLEFFGDTIDSIREFDAETQLSIGQLKEVSIAPMREFAATAKDFRDWAFFAEERFSDDRFARNLKDRTQFAAEGETFSGWEFLISLVQPKKSSVFDYLKDAVLVIDEPALVEQTLGAFYETLDQRFAEISEADDIGLAPNELFLDGKELREKFENFQRLELRALGKTAAQTDEQFQI